MNPLSTLFNASTSHDSFANWNVKQVKYQKQGTSAQKCQPPNLGTILINIDASFVTEIPQSGDCANTEKSPSALPGGLFQKQPDEPPSPSTIPEPNSSKSIVEPVWRNIDSLAFASRRCQWIPNKSIPGHAHPEAEQNRGPEQKHYPICLEDDSSETNENLISEVYSKERLSWVGELTCE
ncbi:hypothetical protein ACJRO7_015892 [Eucalyptus globulus]|uniref:Uncharacterized protein n=1 Tax=Eucalyptus globulus TaxID=34317 RepID=A0ABD3L590_EUCGL